MIHLQQIREGQQMNERKNRNLLASLNLLEITNHGGEKYNPRP